jgi:hypothetical protein
MDIEIEDRIEVEAARLAKSLSVSSYIGNSAAAMVIENAIRYGMLLQQEIAEEKINGK